MSDRMAEAQWAEDYWLVESTARVCPAKLLDPRHRCDRFDFRGTRPPLCFGPLSRWRSFDHASMWRIRDERWPVVVVGQPYGLDQDGLEELLVLARAGLEVNVDARGSWHLPGSTLLIEAWVPGAFSRAWKKARVGRRMHNLRESERGAA